jgi:hypothetical protein
MADKSSQLVLDALHRAARDPAGTPLFGRKAAPGLFASTAVARQAAQRCKEQDLLRVVATEPRGKQTQELVAITAKGLDQLLLQSAPRQVFEDLIRAVEGRERQLKEIIGSARQAQAQLGCIQELAETVLGRIDHQTGAGTFHGGAEGDGEWLLGLLKDWHAGNPAKDCPLPHLFKQTENWTIGRFHDALRRLQEKQKAYLHPWTGPLSELPEPHLALLVGHEIAFYVSGRGE